MSESNTFEIHDALGAGCQNALIEVPFGGAVAVVADGSPVPLQSAPRTAFDADGVGTVTLARISLEKGASLTLRPSSNAATAAPAFAVTHSSAGIVISSAGHSVRLPADAVCDAPYPGPIAGLKLGDGKWFGESRIVHAPGRGYVTTAVESIGPCFIQWRTTYRWGLKSHSFRVRWTAGTETLLIEEVTPHDTDAAIEWHPFGATAATAHDRGGGEGLGPMRPIASPRLEGVVRLPGRRILNWLSHVSYFNQWNLAWCGFAAQGDGRFVGLFTGWSHAWLRRGHVRPELIEEDAVGGLIRLPIKRGRRLWGLVFTTRAESGMDSTTERCMLNHCKTQLSDLPIAKTCHWDLDPPLEPRALRLIRQDDFDTFRDRMTLDPSIAPAIDRFLQANTPNAHQAVAAAVWKRDDGLMRQSGHAMAEWAKQTLADMADGGYERVIIFDGRAAKRMAYDVDVLWHLDLIDEAEYRMVRKALLALSYIFVDPDYCRYEDFWTKYDPEDEGVGLAMVDDMGDCPVPPNFASEFFTTTGVVAELCPGQREHRAWRDESTRLMDLFLETYFESDGTYLESMNYHNHGFNEMLCQLYVQQIKGVRDWLADPKVTGSFEHFAQVRLPQVANALAKADPSSGRLAEPDRQLRSPLPANGNSGSNGCEQEYGGQLALGAWLYRDRNPALAGELMAAWRENGKPLLDIDHPILTLTTLDPSIESYSSPRSIYRRSLGLVSRADRPTGEPVWALFRAGHATHHMDFDQGNLHLAAYDRVLLGEHGYHTTDPGGHHYGGAFTWLHNTIVYSTDRDDTSGYTGLEHAPDPICTYVSDEFDYAAVTIVNDDKRRPELSYRDMIPVARTVHTRCYLFVKPDYFVLWDTFAQCPSETTFWLHPHDPVTPLGNGAFRCGEAAKPNLLLQFVLPAEPEVVENSQWGPLWNFAVRQPAGAPYLTVLHPQREAVHLTATLSADRQTLKVAAPGFADEITLPPAGSPDLPVVRRLSPGPTPALRATPPDVGRR